MKSPKLAAYVSDWLSKEDRSMRWLARKAHISPTVVDDMTKGHVPKMDYLIAVERAMGIEPGELINLAGQVAERGGVSQGILSNFTRGWRNLPPDLQDRTAEVFTRMAPGEWRIWLMRIIGAEPSSDSSASDDGKHKPDEVPPPPSREKDGKQNKVQSQRRGKDA
jgi:lambda repressor-like predicted transcriptional regulator